MSERNEPRRSVLGWAVLGGAVVMGVVGALAPQPSDLNAASGAVYGFVLGAITGVVADRRRA